MSRINTLAASLLLIAGSSWNASAFSMLGPLEAWQTGQLNFPQPYELQVGSRNLGDEFRLNIPTVTYAFDPSFLDYFGTKGVKAVDEAMALLNALPPVSSTSRNLSEFPLTTSRINHLAQTVGLVDVKSVVLGLMMEHFGLLGEGHVFETRTVRGPCGGRDYSVVIRNFDPLTRFPTRFVNGTLYNFTLKDDCALGVDVVDALEIPADETQAPFSAVASHILSQRLGMFYTGLTRDDVGGLRYLYSKNNLNFETLPTQAVVTSPAANPWSAPVFAGTNVVGGGLGGSNLVFSPNNVRRGVEKISFQKVKNASTFSPVFLPFTKSFTLNTISSNNVSTRERVAVTYLTPDIVFFAGDLGDNTTSFRTTPIFHIAGTNGLGSAAGPGVNVLTPGVINPGKSITLNKWGPFFSPSDSGFLLSSEVSPRGYVWGSFNATTNEPVIYPLGTTIAELEEKVLRGGGLVP